MKGVCVVLDGMRVREDMAWCADSIASMILACTRVCLMLCVSEWACMLACLLWTYYVSKCAVHRQRRGSVCSVASSPTPRAVRTADCLFTDSCLECSRSTLCAQNVICRQQTRTTLTYRSAGSMVARIIAVKTFLPFTVFHDILLSILHCTVLYCCTIVFAK